MAWFGNKSAHDRLMDLLPGFYAKEPGSTLYALIDSIAGEVEEIDQRRMYIDSMISISTSYGDMLDERWGKLLNIVRYPYETDMLYKSRMLASVASVIGGTAKAIQYTVAAVMGITDEAEVAQRVIVSDGWTYNGPERSDPSWNPDWEQYGMFIVRIDLNGLDFGDVPREVIDNMLSSTINDVKAAGTGYHMFVTGVRYKTYQQIMDADETYATLSRFKYSELG